MKILVTGAKGFVGRNLTENFKSIRDGKRMIPGLEIDEIFEYDICSDRSELEEFCRESDFVFNLAGVNRTADAGDYMKGNYGFAAELLDLLRKKGNKCPIMFSSSIQACCSGIYEHSEYGRSKKAAEDLILAYGKENEVPVYIYRFPNVYGKWCRPNYNSAIATFCNNIANDMPIQINDRNTGMELLYIDDLVDGMTDLLKGCFHRCEYRGTETVESAEGVFCFVPKTDRVTLGEVADLLYHFRDRTDTINIPELPADSFERKLYSTYLSFLPKEKTAFTLAGSSDSRGSFTELLRTDVSGQISVSITKPGMIRGQHWHNSKSELFIIVSGHGLIQERRIGSDEILEYEVSGEKMEAVYMLPGYTHNLINLSEDKDLITVIWANEAFDPDHPDTFSEKV